MKQYVKPEITVKEYRVSEDIAANLKEYYYLGKDDKGNNINISLFVNSGTTLQSLMYTNIFALKKHLTTLCQMFF